MCTYYILDGCSFMINYYIESLAKHVGMTIARAKMETKLPFAMKTERGGEVST